MYIYSLFKEIEDVFSEIRWRSVDFSALCSYCKSACGSHIILTFSHSSKLLQYKSWASMMGRSWLSLHNN